MSQKQVQMKLNTIDCLLCGYVIGFNLSGCAANFPICHRCAWVMKLLGSIIGIEITNAEHDCLNSKDETKSECFTKSYQSLQVVLDMIYEKRKADKENLLVS